MTEEYSHDDVSRPRGISRRQVIKLMAMSGLLAACRPVEKLVTPTGPPGSPTAFSLTPTTAPAVTPTTAPTATPTTAPTAAPTTAPSATPLPPGLEIIRFHPDVPSRVVRARHTGVWDGDMLLPEALRQLLDASITGLTGLSDAREAWSALFKPDERIAIKVNSIANGSTHAPLAMAVAGCLQEAGIPAEQIVIFDRSSGELDWKDYPINEDGPGVRCYGTRQYTAGWTLIDSGIQLSDILLSCDALINIPVLKVMPASPMGISFALKNHYGTFNIPSSYHGQRAVRGIPELNMLPPIKERTRLIIGDVLEAGSNPGSRTGIVGPGNVILMSFDSVAHDTLGLQIASEKLAAEGANPKGIKTWASSWLEHAAELGLGTNDPGNMDLVEVNLG